MSLRSLPTISIASIWQNAAKFWLKHFKQAISSNTQKRTYTTSSPITAGKKSLPLSESSPKLKNRSERVREPWFAHRPGAVWSVWSASRHILHHVDIFGPKRYMDAVPATLSIDSIDIVLMFFSCFNGDKSWLTQVLSYPCPWTPQAYDAPPHLHSTGGSYWTHVRSSGWRRVRGSAGSFSSCWASSLLCGVEIHVGYMILSYLRHQFGSFSSFIFLKKSL